MKKILLVTILALSINLFAQSPISNIYSVMNGGKHQTSKLRSLTPIDDSIYYSIWDTISNGWKNREKIINIVYDANNNMSSGIVQSWNGNSWINHKKVIDTFDANNNNTSELGKKWNGTTYIDSTKYSYTYDANNNQTSEIDQIWNGSTWVNDYQYSYTYAGNNKANELDQTWNGNGWSNTDAYTYTYSSSYNYPTDEIHQTWNGSNWVKTDDYIVQPPFVAYPTGKIHELFNGNTYLYDEDISYTYNVNNSITGESAQSAYNATAINWRTTYHKNYTYDANGFLTSDSYQHWDTLGIKIKNGYKIDYYFHTVTGIIENSFVSAIVVYPNPTSGIINIRLGQSEKAEIKITDMLGNNIYQNIFISSNFQIDLNSQPNGVYFIQIQTVQGTVNKKIVINH